MCIIIAKNAGTPAIAQDYFERAWDNNSHGGGIVWKKKDGQVYIQKGFMDKQEMMNKLKEINEETTSFIAHFRIKSVGEIKPENCHPFNMDLVTFAHNGTLSIQPLEGKTDSETFGLAFLKNKPMSWIKEYQALLEMALGSSKFAIMDNENGEIFILNKDLGKERDGAWFSNSSAFEPEKPTYTPAAAGSQGYWWGRHWYGHNTAYKPLMSFGTKNFTKPSATYRKDRGCFVWSASAKPCSPYSYKYPVVIDKRGMYKIDNLIVPNPNFESKKYDKRSKELKVIAKYQSELQKMLSQYRFGEYETIYEREEREEDISALNTVLNCMRRLVGAQKVINATTLQEFCLDNIEREKFGNALDTAYMDYAKIYVDDILNSIEGAVQTEAQIVNDTVGVEIANDNTEVDVA